MTIFFFFNDTATTEIYTLSLHDALPISHWLEPMLREYDSIYEFWGNARLRQHLPRRPSEYFASNCFVRSEEHTSELQSRLHLVCRLLLEKKKKKIKHNTTVYIITTLQNI